MFVSFIKGLGVGEGTDTAGCTPLTIVWLANGGAGGMFDPMLDKSVCTN